MQDEIVPDPGSDHQPDRVEPTGWDERPPGTDGRWNDGPEVRALGRTVRELRARRCLSQEGLGNLASMHRNYVGAVERGEINPTFRILLKLCHGLHISLVELATVYERQYMAQLGVVPSSRRSDR